MTTWRLVQLALSAQPSGLTEIYLGNLTLMRAASSSSLLDVCLVLIYIFCPNDRRRSWLAVALACCLAAACCFEETRLV